MYFIARDDVAMAHHALARLSAAHSGFFGLRELKARAHRSLYRGKDALYEGLLASSGRLQLLSKAASELALAQTLACEVGELIDPPPVTPSDMGLKPWQPEYSVEAEYGPGFPR
jgi:hypothetical protein